MQAELFQKQGRGWFRIVSGSMRPLIDIHDRILVERVNSCDVRPRDIILFKNSDALVSHRAIKLLRRNSKTLILQKGDAGGNAGLIDAESEQGRVVAVEKNGGGLRFDEGKLGFLNHMLGLRNSYGYRFDQKFALGRQTHTVEHGAPSAALGPEAW